MMPGFRLTAASFYQPTIMLALALMAVIMMMVLPMPAWVLDLGLALSFALAIDVYKRQVWKSISKTLGTRRFSRNTRGFRRTMRQSI